MRQLLAEFVHVIEHLVRLQNRLPASEQALMAGITSSLLDIAVRQVGDANGHILIEPRVKP
jgi:hypothetical protein